MTKKKNSNKCLVLKLILATVFFATGTYNITAQPTVLTAKEFIEQVRLYHPVAKQANLVVEQAAASLQAARGNFDPLAGYEVYDKTLDGTNYYQYRNAQLKIPTTIGVDVKAGYENSSGSYINPEFTKGVASYLGIEVPLLSGLLIDKKRAVLKQAKIYQDQSEQEKIAMINDLLFDAYGAFWSWCGSYRLFEVYGNYVNIAFKRLQLTKILFANGDRAVADTLEAFAQWQNFRFMQSEALLELKNKAIDLSQFLWNEQANPYLLPDLYVPDTADFERLYPLAQPEEIITKLYVTNPELRTYTYKLENLQVEKRLKFQGLLPVLNVQASALSKDYFTYKNFNNSYLENNYKFGLNLRVPLFLRQARGEYRNAQIKIKQTDLALREKGWQLQNKVKQYHNEATQRQEQLSIAQTTFRNYASLLKLEELKFSQGESSLFLINTRENKALEMQQKLIETRVKYLKSVYAIEWVAGNLR
jgi:outer membrane protein TolC